MRSRTASRFSSQPWAAAARDRDGGPQREPIHNHRINALHRPARWHGPCKSGAERTEQDRRNVASAARHPLRDPTIAQDAGLLAVRRYDSRDRHRSQRHRLRARRRDVACVPHRSPSPTGSCTFTRIRRTTLVAAQVALSLVLVAATALLARSFVNAERGDPGVDAERIAVIGTNLLRAGVTSEEAPTLAAQILERIGALPGVENAALTMASRVAPMQALREQ
jgi:hypothetical protein